MRIVLAGPTETGALRSSLGLALKGAPPGTAQTPLAPLAAALHALGAEVHVLTLDPTLDTPMTIGEAGIGVTYCPIRDAPRCRARVRSRDLFEVEIRCLEDAMRAIQPDIVHAHWTYEYAEAAVRSCLPHIVTMHDLGWEYFWQFRDAYRFVRLIMKYRTMPRVKNLTVVAPFMRQKAWQYGYFGPVTVIPNGVEIANTMPDVYQRNLTRPRIVTIGNRGRIKNVRKSLEAFRIIRQRVSRAELHLFGHGLDSEYAAAEAGAVGHDIVPHDQLMAFLRDEATIVVHPSRLETFGMIIAEAKAQSVPVVAGLNSGGVGYVCGESAGCSLVDVSDPLAIAEASLQLMRDAPSYRQHAKLAYADASKRFSNDKVAGQYLAAYRHVLQSVTDLRAS